MWYRPLPRDARRPIWHRCWRLALWTCWLLASSAPASAHDLAIDQLMLWPDRETGTLRGELTFDPELTRSKDAQPTDEHARRAVEFLRAHLMVTLDNRSAPLAFEVRELWVRGGATLGDVVRFSAPLAATEHELRVHASGFRSLVVSVQRNLARQDSTQGNSSQRVSAQPVSAQRAAVQRSTTVAGSSPNTAGATASPAASPVETTSWLLAANESTPVFRVDAGWQAPGWRLGGPDVFVEAGSTDHAAAKPAATGAEPALPGPTADAADATREASSTRLASRFVLLGFEHILPGGIDHVLFVAGLVLARTRRYRQVLISLSLFTLAHTLTLALGNFQVVQVPSEVVEPLIAFSIFVLGVDNLRASRSVETPASLRYLVVFCFGLVHGLGFASALSELAFDADHLVLALFSFNIGVELGQIAVVVLLALLLHALGRWRGLERYATLAGSAAIAAAGLFMVVDRVTHSEGPAASAVIPGPFRLFGELHPFRPPLSLKRVSS